MELFKRMKKNKEADEALVERLNDEIVDQTFDPDKKVEDVLKLYETREKVRMRGFDKNEILKVAANVAIVGVIVVFEMYNVMNQKASRFIKTL